MGIFEPNRGTVLRKISLMIAAAAIVFAASSAVADTTPPAPSADANSTPAAATPPAGTPAAPGTTANPATTTAAVDPNAEVCKRMAPETGTRIGSRMVCKTNAQWEAEMRQTQSSARGLENHMTGYTGPQVAGH